MQSPGRRSSPACDCTRTLPGESLQVAASGSSGVPTATRVPGRDREEPPEPQGLAVDDQPTILQLLLRAVRVVQHLPVLVFPGGIRLHDHAPGLTGALVAFL